MPRRPAFCRLQSAASALLALLVVCCASFAQGPTVSRPTAAALDRLNAAYGRLPLSFEPNRGQVDAHVQFLARSPQASILLSGADAILETSSWRSDQRGQSQLAGSSALRMHLAGAAAAPAAMPEQPLAGRMNYLRGNDRTDWQTDLPTFGGVRLAAVYPGIDLRYYGHSGQLEYDFIVAPEGNPAAIKLQFEGSHPAIAGNGDLVLPVAGVKDLRFDKPVAYQTVDGKRIPVEASFALAANHDVAFQLGAYDHTRELVIDPTLIYLGTLGTGVSDANVNQITVDSAGALYFIGTTRDAAYPTTAGALQTVCGPSNPTAANSGTVYCMGNNTSAYVTKLSPDGTKLIYSTFLSGHGGIETGNAIAVDAAGVAYLFGMTGSNDFPVTADAFQKNCFAFYGAFGAPNPVPCAGFYNGGGTEYTIENEDAFFAKLNPAGSALLYSSFLGGAQPVYPSTIALDAGGNIYLYGQTEALSVNSKSTGALQFTGLTPSGYLTVASAQENGPGGAIHDIYVAAFLDKFTNDGRTLLYGTFFGDNVYGVDFNPRAMAVASNGIAYLSGYSSASNQNNTAGTLKTACTLVNPNDNTHCTSTDGFLAAIDTTKSGAASLVWSTRLGGTEASNNGFDVPTQILGLTVDASNNLYATGLTQDHTLPVGPGGFQPACPNADPNMKPGDFERCDSAFVVKVNPSGTKVLGGTFLGSTTIRGAESVGYNVRLDSKGQVYVYGRSNDGGGDFPQLNPLPGQGFKGGTNLFITALTTDFSRLLFSTRFSNPSFTDHSVSPAGGMVLDANDNIYFAGTTNDVVFAGTTGTYNTQLQTGAGNHTFFAKLSKVLQPTSTTITLPTATVTAGGTLTLKASVGGNLQATPVPTGNVTFTYTNTNPGTVAGTATLDATGTATLNLPAPAAGSYTVVASYGGDNTYDVSSSAAATLTVKSPATPAIALVASATSGNIGTSFTFTATLSAASGTPTGTVYFMDGTSTLGSSVLANGVAMYSTALAAGTHSITARYGGDANFTVVASSAQTIAVSLYGSSTTLATSAASVAFGLPVTLTASVAPSATTIAPTGNVTFFDGTTMLGTGALGNGKATLTTTALAAGTHSLTAVYGGDANFSGSTSPAATETIVAASVVLTAAPTSLTIAHGTSGSVVITATPTGALTGSVTFACGSLPQHSTCMFSPATLTFNASSTAQSTTLTLATNTASLTVPGGPFSGAGERNGILAAGLFLPLGLLGLAGRRRVRGALSARIGFLLLVAAACAGTIGLSGCGGTTQFNTVTPGTYSIPVTATVNGGTSSVSLNIIVQ